MKGSIEIYSNNTLVYQNNNLLVDGAGEIIADYMTVSPSLSGIPSASAVLDTSNYTIQAISFGKGSEGYKHNAHKYDASAPYPAQNTKEAFYAVCGLVDNKAVSVIVRKPDDNLMFTSSILPVVGLPTAPTPMDTVLQHNVQLSGAAFTDPDSVVYVAGYNEDMTTFGQNPNYLPYINESGFRDGSGGFGSYFGCFPAGSGMGGTDFYIISGLDMILAEYSPTAKAEIILDVDSSNVSGTYYSIVNEASSMDSRGFIGKVYDAKNKVGVVSNPNMLGYTVDTALDPGITFNADLTGTVWAPFAGGQLGTFSSVLHTNPFGGVSSLILSANGTSTGRQALATYGGYDASLPKFREDSAICYSVYVKAHDNASTSATYFQLNVYDKDAPLISYSEDFEFINGVPTIDGTPAASSTTTIEDATNGWYRLGITVDGLANTGTSEGDKMIPIFYIGNTNEATNPDVQNKEIYWYAPQVEQHPTAYGITLPSPYQAVSGLNPTIAEQNGTGGLHVSGGINASTLGTVIYSVTIGSGDCGMAHLYGGIFHMGLWTIDNIATSGMAPPYTWSTFGTPRREYKLFSKHTLSRDLTFIQDYSEDATPIPGVTQHADLVIIWRLDFF